jgi:hypothetical protein
VCLWVGITQEKQCANASQRTATGISKLLLSTPCWKLQRFEHRTHSLCLSSPRSTSHPLRLTVNGVGCCCHSLFLRCGVRRPALARPCIAERAVRTFQTVNCASTSSFDGSALTARRRAGVCITLPLRAGELFRRVSLPGFTGWTLPFLSLCFWVKVCKEEKKEKGKRTDSSFLSNVGRKS